MSNPNPLIPQGSLLEQKAGKKSHLRVAVFIVAVHLVFLGGLLIQGCKPEDPTTARNDTGTLPPRPESTLPPLDSESLYRSNPPAAQPDALAGGPADLTAPLATPMTPQLPDAPSGETLPPSLREHVVVKNDNFSTLAKRYGVSVGAIARANPTVDPTRLKLGEKLVIPAPTAAPSASTPDLPASDVYVVKSGDNLTRIAKAHHTTANEIKALNGLRTDRINVGQKLKLPASRILTDPPPSSGTLPGAVGSTTSPPVSSIPGRL